jgi:Tol biopolymer transport system component
MRYIVWALITVAATFAATSTPTTQTVTVNEGTNIAATVSPDHKTILFDLQGALWSLPFEGGKAKRLTEPFLEPSRPDYSPKGNLIAFQAYKGGTFHIWTANPDGTNLRQITTGHGDDREPRFSPDATKIAFSSDRAFEGSYDIWVVDLATGKLDRRTSSPDDEYEPAWSPDGSEIAFVSGVGANATKVLAINSSGVIRTIVTAEPETHVNSPSWSPDAKRVAWIAFSKNVSRLVISENPAGTGDDVFPFPAAWLSDNRILYTGNGKIRVTNLDGGQTEDIPFEAQFTLNRPAYKHKPVDLD